MTRKSLFRILIISIFIMLISALLGKVTIASDNARAAADFLNIGIGARAAALGGAFTSVVDDATAAYWNPAGLTSVRGIGINLSHFSWYQDLNLEYFGVAYPVNDRLTLAVSAAYLSYGTIEGYDVNDNPTGNVASTYDLSAGLSAGFRFSDNYSAGLGLKLIEVSLAGTKASAVAVDLGMKYAFDRYLFSLVATNLGQNIKFDQVANKLPVAIKAGVAVKPFGPTGLVSLEIEDQLYGNLIIKNGFELNFNNKYFLRTGYNYFPQQENRILGQGLTFGAGAMFGPAQFDYSFTPRDNFSSETIHRFSLDFHFAK
ncbi:MAG: PorV/PorQ family protein [candidate division Zixibacteria bacterium]|nr:PorV/PorQ family protein [candidate division Zixibacteria bacterium]